MLYNYLYTDYRGLPRGALIIKYCGSTLSAPTLPVTSASRNVFSASIPVSAAFNDLPLASFLSRIRFMRAITACSLSLKKKGEKIYNKTYKNCALFGFSLYSTLSYFRNSSSRT